MKCRFCGVEVDEWNKAANTHLIVTKNIEDNHIHVHGQIEHKENMKELIDAAIIETGINLHNDTLNIKEAIFHNKQRIGDMLMFTTGIRDFKNAFPDIKVNVLSTAMHIWDHNPYIDKSVQPYYKNGKTLETISPEDLFNGNTNVLKIGPSKITNASNRLDWHFANAFRVSIEDAFGVYIQQGESRPDIWLTEEEYNAERITKDPYWIIIIGGEKSWGCKMYPFKKWQEFVKQNPDILFYQLGTREDAHQKLEGKNIVDYLGKTQDPNTGIRDLFKLFLNAEGSIGLVSFHMHLSGALYKPCIVVAGAREPVAFTRYQGHQYLTTEGCLPCAATTACWHCNIDKCTDLVTKEEKIPRCVDMIEPEDLTRALKSYYIGGRLKKNVISQKPKLKNIVPTPPKPIVPIEESITNTKVKYGLEFGGGYLTEDDWKFIRTAIKENNVKTILEFRASLSTLLLNELGLKVITYETCSEDIDKIKVLNSKCDIRKWDGKSIDNAEKIDFAFVNGPSGGINREFSTQIASKLANIIVIHDAGRKHERVWQSKYIEADFSGLVKGGHRCSLWFRKSKLEAQTCLKNDITEPIAVTPKGEAVEASVIQPNRKYIKLVSTARGFGGCARSILTIMNRLTKEGHKVEFIPFHNTIGSNEFKTYVKDYLPNLIVSTDFNTIKESCDVLFVYADDYVWEFNSQPIREAFSGINADKKIMMLNYRRGKVGEIEWTKGWDKYMFLNSSQERELLKVLPGVKTKVLPPCTELEEFLKIQPNYFANLHLVRVSSQGDTKFEHDDEIKDGTQQPFFKEVDNILATRSDVTISMLPGPSFIPNRCWDRFYKVGRTSEAKKVAEFLGTGNLFWYSLPPGYMDMGPRVAIEALASGLAILGDNWGGLVDRVTEETGWLCNTKEEHALVVKEVTPELLETRGMAAKQRANDEFKPEAWIKEILD